MITATADTPLFGSSQKTDIYASKTVKLWYNGERVLVCALAGVSG